MQSMHEVMHCLGSRWDSHDTAGGNGLVVTKTTVGQCHQRGGAWDHSGRA